MSDPTWNDVYERAKKLAKRLETSRLVRMRDDPIIAQHSADRARNAMVQKAIREELERRSAIMKTCGHTPTTPHVCPYQDEINGDSATLCRCCDACQQECANDI